MQRASTVSQIISARAEAASKDNIARKDIWYIYNIHMRSYDFNVLIHFNCKEVLMELSMYNN